MKRAFDTVLARALAAKTADKYIARNGKNARSPDSEKRTAIKRALAVIEAYMPPRRESSCAARVEFDFLKRTLEADYEL